MNIAINLEHYVPAAEYFGSLTANDKAAFDALDWRDSRPKPTWEEVSSFVAPTPVPQVVSAFQAKAALFSTPFGESNLFQVVEEYMTTADTIVKLAWTTATEFRRESPTIAGIASYLSLSDKQVDDLFILAESVVA